MRYCRICILLAATLLPGCDRAHDEQSPRERHGRHSGIGIYPAGQSWSLIAAPKPGKDMAAARPDDDDQVIVTVDGVTGEIRQCGNVSGFCIGMNPWAGALPAAQVSPARLTKHAADVAREAEAQAPEDEAEPVLKTGGSRRRP